MTGWSRFAAELRKLARLFRADPRAIAAGIIAPTAILLVFAVTFGNMSSLRIAVVNHDSGPLGASLAQSILSQVSPAGGKPYFVQVTGDETEAADLFAAGKIAAVVTIGEDFTEDVEQGSSPSIDFTFDNYSSDMAKNLRLYLQEGIVAFYGQEYDGYDLQVDRAYTVDSQVDWFDLIAVGVFMLAFLIGAMFSLLYLLYQEKTLGTATEYALSPRSPWPFWAARLSFSLVLATVTGTVNAVLIWLVAGLNVAPLIPSIIVPLLLVTGIWVSLAAIVALVVRRFAGAAVGTIATAVIAWFLSGGTSSVRHLEGAPRALAESVPNTWALELIRSSAFGYSISTTGRYYAQLTGVFVILLAVASAVYYRRFARRR